MKAFEPFRIGKLELKTRLVVSAMVTNYCNPDGTPTEKYLAYHEHKARGGWGSSSPRTTPSPPRPGDLHGCRDCGKAAKSSPTRS